MIKRALLIGVNEYVEAPLKGCINDVDLMASVLSTQFNITTLKNEEATKQNIIKNIKQCLKGLKRRDSLIFYFSGYGAQVPKGMHFANCLLPFDFDWNNVITHRELEDLLASKSNVEVIIDAGYSGDGTPNVLFNGHETRHKQKYIKAPRDLFKKVQNAFTAIIETFEDKNIIVWESCGKYECSQETYIDKYYGAFTYVFVCALGESRSLTLFKVREGLKKLECTQEPQLSCIVGDCKEKPFDGHLNWFDRLKIFIKNL